MKSKMCRVCKATKPATEFHKHTANKADGLSYWCKPCASAYHRKLREENPEKLRAYSRNYSRRYRDSQRYREVRMFLDSLKDKPCADCSNTYPPYVMDWDHVSGDKKFGIGSKKDIRDLPHVLEEITKCELVCANCHRIRTHKAGRVGRPRLK